MDQKRDPPVDNIHYVPHSNPSVQVVVLAFISVAQYRIRLRKFFELLLCLNQVRVLVNIHLTGATFLPTKSIQQQ